MDRKVLAHMAMLAFSFLVAGSYSLGGQISNLIDPVALMTVRFGLAAVMLGCFTIGTIRFELAFARAPWRFLVLGGLLATFFALMFVALKSATPLSTSAVFTLTPFLSALFGALILKQTPSPRVVLVLGLGCIGALWIIFEGNLSQFIALNLGKGEAFFFVGCVAYALYVPLSAKLNRGEPTAFSVFFATLAGFGLLLSLSAPSIVSIEWIALPSIVWLGLAYLTVGSTVLTFLLIQYAALNMDSLNVMSYTFLTPGWVLLWEWALTSSLPTATTLVGVSITIIVMIILFKLAREPQSQS